MRCPLWSSLLAIVVFATTARAEVVFENVRFRAVLGDDAAWRSLVDKKSGKGYCAAKGQIPFADAVIGGKTCPANRASFSSGRLTIGLAGCDTQLAYTCSSGDDWISFRLDGISGTRPSHVTVVRIGVTITDPLVQVFGLAPPVSEAYVQAEVVEGEGLAGVAIVTVGAEKSLFVVPANASHFHWTRSGEAVVSSSSSSFATASGVLRLSAFCASDCTSCTYCH